MGFRGSSSNRGASVSGSISASAGAGAGAVPDSGAGRRAGRAGRRFRHRVSGRWPRFGRWWRTLAAAVVVGAVVVPLSAALRPRIPAPPPARTAPLSRATLTATYEANRADAAEASRMAAAHGDRQRAAADRALAAPSRDLLTFDGRGTGRATEVFGDLGTAEHIAVLVPGSDTTLDTYGRFRAGALALYRAAGPRTAVAAWLGYDTPRVLSTGALTTSRAEEAAPLLERFMGELRRALGASPRVSLLCHSYGTVVCADAAHAVVVEDIVLVGSPGTGVDSAAGLHTRARVWAARGAGDWVAHVPHISADLFGTRAGFGTDPVSPAYGARVFSAGGGGHSDYFTPGSASLDNLARIVLGGLPEPTHG